MKNGMYATVEAVRELNKVEGFRPEDYLMPSEESPEDFILATKHKILWFRLKYPNGKIRKIIHKVDHVSAIVEVRIYANASDEDYNFIANGISQRFNDNETPQGVHYLSWAMTSATSQALDDAAFGIQFSDLSGSLKPAEPVNTGQAPENRASGKKEDKPDNEAGEKDKDSKPHLSVVGSTEDQTIAEKPTLNRSEGNTEAVQTSLTEPEPDQRRDELKQEKAEETPGQQQDDPIQGESSTSDTAGETEVQEEQIATEQVAAVEKNSGGMDKMPEETAETPNDKEPETAANEEPAKLPDFHPMTPVSQILPHMTYGIAYTMVIPTGAYAQKVMGKVLEEEPELVDYFKDKYLSDNRVRAAAAFMKQHMDSQTA